MMRSPVVATVLVVASLAFVPSANAAPSEGEVLFREGRAAMQQKDFDKACLKFTESQKKDPAPGTSLNLGDCEEQRGHLVAASDAFVAAAAGFSTADKKKYAQSRADTVDRRIPRLTVRTSVKTPGLVVRAGSTALVIDTETKMDPGEVALRAEAPRKKPKDLKATLHEGKNLEVDIGALEDVKLEIVATRTTVAPAKPKTSTERLRTISLVGGGVGVASLLVGGVTGILSLKKASTVKEHCDANLACDGEGVDAASSGHTFSTVSTITLVAGGALVLGSAALWYFGWRTKHATVAPSASRDGGGLTVVGRF